MKIINAGGITNSFIYPIANGCVVVDTGYDGNYVEFCEKLEKNNIVLSNIRYIFLTHAHDDHAGFLNELLRDTQAKVILHPDALDGLHRGQNALGAGAPSRLAKMFFKFIISRGRGEHRFPTIKPEYIERCIEVSDDNRRTLETELNGKIIETPGHTTCSLSLLLSDGILFCGDAAMGGPSFFHRATISIEDLDTYCSSWEKILALNPVTLYPGHGRPFPASDLRRFLPKVRNAKLYPVA